MKNKIKTMLILAFAACISLTGCGEQKKVELLKQEISALQQEKESLQAEISELDNVAIEKKEENGTAKYVLTLEVKQTHFTLDVSERLKDKMNATEIQIPVDKE